MSKTIGQENMERYREFEQELRDKGDNKMADIVRQGAKLYMNSCLSDFTPINLGGSLFPYMDPMTGEKITEEGRCKMFEELTKNLIYGKKRNQNRKKSKIF